VSISSYQLNLSCGVELSSDDYSESCRTGHIFVALSKLVVEPLLYTFIWLTTFEYSKLPNAGSSARHLSIQLFSDASLDAETFNLWRELGSVLNGGVVKISTVGASHAQTSIERRWIAGEVATTGAFPVAAGSTREVLAPRAVIAHIRSCDIRIIL
jgi:hypothetical protein